MSGEPSASTPTSLAMRSMPPRGNTSDTALGLVERALGTGETVLILQTLAEFYTMATRTLETSPEDACSFLAGLRAALPVYAATAPDLDKAMLGTQRHGLSFWDAMLWATADRIGVRYLLTADFRIGACSAASPSSTHFEAGTNGSWRKCYHRQDRPPIKCNCGVWTGHGRRGTLRGVAQDPLSRRLAAGHGRRGPRLSGRDHFGVLLYHRDHFHLRRRV